MTSTNLFSVPSSKPGFSILPVNTHVEESLNDSTLQAFNQFANEDVEMQAPLSESGAFVVVDTNILLHDFDVLVQFVEDVERENVPVVIIIPGVVIQELDGHKHNQSLRWFSTRSSTWLLKKVQERRSVKGQATEETLRRSGNWRVTLRDEVRKDGDRGNDELIVDCCKYFALIRRTVLWSGDKNLCFDVHAERTIGALSPDRRQWTSRYLIGVIFENTVDLGRFTSEKPRYKRGTRIVEETSQLPSHTRDPDGMDIDEEEQTHAIFSTSNVVHHFSALLSQLVLRVGSAEIRSYQTRSVSRYAPEWQHNRKPIAAWSVSELLEYLDGKKCRAATNPRLEWFLQLAPSYRPDPKTNDSRGSRRGQDWSRTDWLNALGGLKQIGINWADTPIQESLAMLERELTFVFSQEMAII
ncbi:PIN domain-containing protein [Armillaria luteobubalina]|uniref:PIN domain-containing protein n=1 Tax=Armillaria luteobubalina TaxID=153913 RepID=A0AA39UV26_9AGAR|nr:PIN domain-containing protein [Armillaria luteobubalina]